jgi:hypothetical protein
VNTDSGVSALFLRKNHTFTTWPMGQTLESRSMDQLLTWTRQRYQHCPTPLVPRPSPTIAGRGRNNSTNRSGAQSPFRPHTGSRRLLYAGSPKEPSDAAPNRRTRAARGEIDVKAHQILARRMLRTPRRIPPPEQEMQDPQAHGR